MRVFTQLRNFAACCLLGVAALLHPSLAQAADSSTNHMGSHMMQSCQQMMQERQKMLSEMKQQDQQLQALADKINQGPPQQKLDRLVQLVQRLVKDRVATHEKMEAMHSHMMEHMAQHMQQGGSSLAHCPMMHSMEGMGGSGDETQQEHGQHHGGGSANP